MQYYLDDTYRVHVAQNTAGTYAAWEDVDGVFANKCLPYVEGYRVIPAGCHWAGPDGVVLIGEMITPVMDIRVLEGMQQLHEQTQHALEAMRAEYDAALCELGELIAEGGT